MKSKRHLSLTLFALCLVSLPCFLTAEDNMRSYASVNGKYAKLIQVLNCPGDESTYGEFRDYGFWGGGNWCGQTGKAGYWVWVSPNWYVWEYIK